MKYIKTYESYTVIKQYWGIKTSDEYFVISLEKIGCPEKMITTFVKELEIDKMFTYDKPFTTTFVAKYTTLQNTTWYISTRGSDFADSGYEYMGSPSFTKEEVEQINFEKDAKRYNI